MSIEAISSNVMSQQMNRVDNTVAPVESPEAVSALQVQDVIPVKAAQGSDDSNAGDRKDREKDGNDEGKSLQEVSPEKIRSAVADINKKIAPTQTALQFSYHEKTHRISITVRDKETDKVIREIPPEKTLDMIAKSLELAGILVDEKR